MGSFDMAALHQSIAVDGRGEDICESPRISTLMTLEKHVRLGYIRPIQSRFSTKELFLIGSKANCADYECKDAPCRGKDVIVEAK